MVKLTTRKSKVVAALLVGATAAMLLAVFKATRSRPGPPSKASKPARKATLPRPRLDVTDYNRRMLRLAHVSTTTVTAVSAVGKPPSPAKHRLWPARAPYPRAGAILPFHRVVAFYGNFHSQQMGILGQYPEDEVLARLQSQVALWKAADPQTPVLPAIHYVAITAQGSAGADGKHRLRMADREIEKAIRMARKVGGVTFLDVQVGLSTVEDEVPTLDRYLKQPDIHLGLDPEFAMKGGVLPGQKIGTMDAAEINWAIAHLSKIVDQYDLPPKILVVHRFVKDMVTHMPLIRPAPEVQVVIDMDGWGRPDEKKDIYRYCITRTPVQFTGFKIFYRNDTRKPGSRLMTPQEVLALTPAPIYIQYQ